MSEKEIRAFLEVIGSDAVEGKEEDDHHDSSSELAIKVMKKEMQFLIIPSHS